MPLLADPISFADQKIIVQCSVLANQSKKMKFRLGTEINKLANKRRELELSHINDIFPLEILKTIRVWPGLIRRSFYAAKSPCGSSICDVAGFNVNKSIAHPIAPHPQ